MGESFGYSIVEPLMFDKPVIAPHWIRNPLMDKNHIKILKNLGLLYRSPRHLVSIYEKLIKKSAPAGHYSKASADFDPESAVAKLQVILMRI
jgi:hypothetical protein